MGVKIRKAGAVPPMSEKAWQKIVTEAAAACGWKRQYHTFDSRRSAAGFPDLVLVRRRRVIFAELKRDGKSPTAEQAAWLAELREAGQEAYCWRPADWADVQQVLRRETR
jgi:hypothetical protein